MTIVQCTMASEGKDAVKPYLYIALTHINKDNAAVQAHKGEENNHVAEHEILLLLIAIGSTTCL